MIPVLDKIQYYIRNGLQQTKRISHNWRSGSVTYFDVKLVFMFWSCGDTWMYVGGVSGAPEIIQKHDLPEPWCG
jgi:hypothetical protein